MTTARHEAIAIGLWRVRLDQTRTRCNFTRTRFSLATVLQDNVDPPDVILLMRRHAARGWTA